MKSELTHVIKFLNDVIESNKRSIERHRNITVDERCQGFADGQEIVLCDIEFIRNWLADILEDEAIKQ